MERVPVLAIESGPEALALRAASAVAERISHKSGRFGLCLSGGTTPRRAYELLGAPPLRDAIDWQRIHVFWGDERFVPPDHPDSNYRMACEALLEKVQSPRDKFILFPWERGRPRQRQRSMRKSCKDSTGARFSNRSVRCSICSCSVLVKTAISPRSSPEPRLLTSAAPGSHP